MLSTLVSLLAAASTFQPSVSQRVVTQDALGPKVELGVLSEPLRGELSSAARAWALAHRGRWALPAVSTLETAESFGTRFGASFHLKQTVDGVEVHDARLVVTVDEQARVVQVSSSLVTWARLSREWRVDAAGAVERAAAAIPFAPLKPDGAHHGAAKRVFFLVGEELHAGYLVHVPTLDLSKNWYLGIDALTGEQLFAQNRVHFAALSANVYPVSPGGLDAGVGVTPTVSRTLAHLDGGSMVVDSCEVSLPDGGLATLPNDGGYLCGTQLTSFNCCPTAGCAPDAGPARNAGTATIPGIPLPITYDVAVCDRLRRASNDVAIHASGSYEYSPSDPPVDRATVVATDAANSDEFAEVHAFYHVNTVYDWFRGLSRRAQPLFPANQPAIQPFTMRDERRTPARKPAVWANVMFPDFRDLMNQGLSCITNPPCRTNSLARLDNAAFFPVENFADLPLPGFSTGVDTLMIFQGNNADAAYDATVLQHEFGHGAIYATAGLGFDTPAIDSRSANNETGALHEGFADYIAGAFNDLADNGPYFGPRAAAGAGAIGVDQESFLRTMNNTMSCPDVLWGEVHQDSQHVSAALWQGRTGPFAGTDNGDTFDAAFYAMLVSLAPNADFAAVAAVLEDRVGRVFGGATASQQMHALFQARGVIGCSKVLDVTGATQPRPMYGIPTGPSSLGNSLIPGPIQLKLRTPDGVARIRVSGSASGSGFISGPKATSVLLKRGTPITFVRQGGALQHDADRVAATTIATGGALTAAVDFVVPCGTTEEVYVTFAAQAGGSNLSNLRVQYDPLPGCNTNPDAGTPTDGGVDAGTGEETKTIPHVGAGGAVQNKVASTGCGCTTGAGVAPLLALGLLALVRRRR